MVPEGRDGSMNNTLGKLQCQVDKLSKDNTRLRDQVAELKRENYTLRKRLEQKEKEFEERIDKAVNSV